MSIIDPNKGAIDYDIKMFTSKYIEGKTLYELQKEVKEAKKDANIHRPSHISMFGKTKSKQLKISNDLAAKLFGGLKVPAKVPEI